MGFRVLLVAITGKDPEVIHREYGVTPTARYEETPESPVTGARLPTGAYLLYVNDEIIPDDRVLARLSKDASLVVCYANETAMNSLAASWENGSEQWSVYHDAQEGVQHLEIAGSAPAQLPPIHERLFAQQEGVSDIDYMFEVPIELFVAVGGIRYDQGVEGPNAEPWQVLARAKKKHWWWPVR